jgi:hypothetical protein
MPAQLAPWSSDLPEKLSALQLVNKFPVFVETESSLPQSQMLFEGKIQYCVSTYA